MLRFHTARLRQNDAEGIHRARRFLEAKGRKTEVHKPLGSWTAADGATSCWSFPGRSAAEDAAQITARKADAGVASLAFAVAFVVVEFVGE